MELGVHEALRPSQEIFPSRGACPPASASSAAQTEPLESELEIADGIPSGNSGTLRKRSETGSSQ